ncbi:hypothetical protein DOY81_006866 [Sarcophaga bullata]|nr:hypothetical protein DOY81_006866 [Sarcophaga bullata]
MSKNINNNKIMLRLVVIKKTKKKLKRIKMKLTKGLIGVLKICLLKLRTIKNKILLNYLHVTLPLSPLTQ